MYSVNRGGELFRDKRWNSHQFFELDLPRLSVDIDLTFLPVTDRDAAIREINAALVRIAERLKERGIEKFSIPP